MDWVKQSMSAIETDSLTKYYNGLLAVDNISFDVKRGEVFGFLGPNGAGIILFLIIFLAVCE